MTGMSFHITDINNYYTFKKAYNNQSTTRDNHFSLIVHKSTNNEISLFSLTHTEWWNLTSQILHVGRLYIYNIKTLIANF